MENHLCVEGKNCSYVGRNTNMCDTMSITIDEKFPFGAECYNLPEYQTKLYVPI